MCVCVCNERWCQMMWGSSFIHVSCSITSPLFANGNYPFHHTHMHTHQHIDACDLYLSDNIHLLECAGTAERVCEQLSCVLMQSSLAERGLAQIRIRAKLCVWMLFYVHLCVYLWVKCVREMFLFLDRDTLSAMKRAAASGGLFGFGLLCCKVPCDPALLTQAP